MSDELGVIRKDLLTMKKDLKKIAVKMKEKIIPFMPESKMRGEVREVRRTDDIWDSLFELLDEDEDYDMEEMMNDAGASEEYEELQSLEYLIGELYDALKAIEYC